MHSTRNIVRVPSNACRVSRYAAPAARSFSYVPVFPRFQSPFTSSGGDFAPLFKLFDDITTPTLRHARSPVVYQPRFDVEEVEGAYNLRGELPGVESKDIHVEFTDPQTLVIKGQTERSYSSGTPAEASTTSADPASTEQATAAPADNSDAASTHSTGSYVQATVEDDPAEPSTSGQATPAESAAEQPSQPAEQHAVAAEQTQEQTPSSRYWVSERSVGSFQRTFSFPERIDQDNVSASLKNGILNITVPKAPVPAARRIAVE